MITIRKQARNSWEAMELLRWGRDRNPDRKRPGFSLFRNSYENAVENGNVSGQPTYTPSVPHPDIPHPPIPCDGEGRTYEGEKRSVYVSVSYRRFTDSKQKVKANTRDTIDYLLRFEGLDAFSSSGRFNKEELHDAFDDDAVFKIILSPEDPEVMSEDYVRELVSRMEEMAGREFVWAAVIHDNTDHPHAHIIISRTVGDGLSWDSPLKLPADLISRGIREVAQEIATRMLGRKSPDRVKAEMLASVYANGLGRIDHKIFGYPPRNMGLLRITDGGYAVLDKAKFEKLPEWLRTAVLKRLEILSGIPEMEISSDRGGFVCFNPYETKQRLMDYGKLLPFKDIEEQFDESISIIPSNRPLKASIHGTVIRTVVVDDNAPKAGFIIRSSDGRLYYVEGEVSYDDLNSIGKDVDIVPRKAKSERYRTPIVRISRDKERGVNR